MTANAWAAEEPHALFAVTEIVPPAEPTVAGIEFVADVPDHVAGNDHV